MSRNQMYAVLDAAGVAEADQWAITDRVRDWSVAGLIAACRAYSSETLQDAVLAAAKALMYA